MAEAKSCGVCGAPGLRIRHCATGLGDLRRRLLGNQVELLACPACGALWCGAVQPEDPGHPAGVAWPHSLSDWQKVYDLDDGVSLRRWYRKEMRALAGATRPPCRRRRCRFQVRVEKRHGMG